MCKKLTQDYIIFTPLFWIPNNRLLCLFFSLPHCTAEKKQNTDKKATRFLIRAKKHIKFFFNSFFFCYFNKPPIIIFILFYKRNDSAMFKTIGSLYVLADYKNSERTKWFFYMANKIFYICFKPQQRTTTKSSIFVSLKYATWKKQLIFWKKTKMDEVHARTKKKYYISIIKKKQKKYVCENKKNITSKTMDRHHV